MIDPTIVVLFYNCQLSTDSFNLCRWHGTLDRVTRRK